MLGMTAVRGGQTQTTGLSAAARRPVQDRRTRGATWTLIWVPPLDPVIPPNPNLGVGVGDTMFGVRHVKLDPKDPHIVYATAWNNAIHRSAPSLEGGDASFKPVFAIVGPRAVPGSGDVRPHGEGRARRGCTSTTARETRGDAGAVPARQRGRAGVDARDRRPARRWSTRRAWIKLSSERHRRSPGSTSRRICATQCFYDLVVAHAARASRTRSIVGGVATPTFGEPTIRSTNAGVSFSAFGNDAQNPRNDSHVDVRAIVFHPRDPEHRVRRIGRRRRAQRRHVREHQQPLPAAVQQRARSARRCSRAVPNAALLPEQGTADAAVLQRRGRSARRRCTRLIGGLQDNSTIWLDGTGRAARVEDGVSVRRRHVGVRVSSDAVRACCSRASRATASSRTSGTASSRVLGAHRRSDSQQRRARDASRSRPGGSSSRSTTCGPDTQFTGVPARLAHAEQRRQPGGARGESAGSPSGVADGAVRRLGAARRRVSVRGGQHAGFGEPQARRSDERLLRRAIAPAASIVAAERTPADAGTLWAATNFGRLFISKNADGAGSRRRRSCASTRAVDARTASSRASSPIRANPNVAFVSYSGFNALTPSTPGHVFRVVYNPATQRATFTSLDFDLGDLPINTIAFDDVRGDIYAATDFGPLVLRGGRVELAGRGRRLSGSADGGSRRSSRTSGCSSPPRTGSEFST